MPKTTRARLLAEALRGGPDRLAAQAPALANRYRRAADRFRAAEAGGMLDSSLTRTPSGEERDLMAEHPHANELRKAERRLQAAQLAGDIAALDQLLDDRLIFTFGPDGKCYTKQDDLQVHRSRQQVLTKVMEEDLTVLVEGRTGVTWFLSAVEGTFAGAPFAARLRYTRTWIHDDDHGWRVVAAHASPVDGDSLPTGAHHVAESVD